jgi:predicted DNA-binding protein
MRPGRSLLNLPGKGADKMSQTTITKSVRLSPVEAAKLARLSEQQAQSESSLIKKWILQGIQAEQMELAIQAYMRG